MQDTKSPTKTQAFPEIAGEPSADRASRYARWKKAQAYRTESERIAVMQGLDPDAHLTRRELRAKRRHRRQASRTGTPIIEQNGPGRIVKVEIIRRGE